MSASVWFPERLPRDEQAEAENEARIRQGEVDALLRERDDHVRQREAAQARHPKSALIIVDDQGHPVRGLHIRNITKALAREEAEEEIRKLDEAIAIVDRELKARGHRPPPKRRDD